MPPKFNGYEPDFRGQCRAHTVKQESSKQRTLKRHFDHNLHSWSRLAALHAQSTQVKSGPKVLEAS